MRILAKRLGSLSALVVFLLGTIAFTDASPPGSSINRGAPSVQSLPTGTDGPSEQVTAAGLVPVVANFSFGPKDGQICIKFSSGIIGTENPNDPEPELDGAIENKTKITKVFKDLLVWLEKKDGTKITRSGQGNPSPISGISLNTNGTNWANATVVQNSQGVVTFNLRNNGHINLNSFRRYRMQIDDFSQPNSFKVCMAVSDTKASGSVHYMALGTMGVSNDGNTSMREAQSPSHRSGVVVALENEDTVDTLTGATIQLMSAQSGLTILGASVLDIDYGPVPGASVAIDSTGRTLTVDGLELDESEFVNVWIDLSTPPIESTVFQGQGIF